MKMMIGVIAVCTALSAGTASAYIKDADRQRVYTDKIIYELQDNIYRMKNAEQYIKEVVPYKDLREKALKETAHSLRGLDKLIKLTVMIQQAPPNDSGGFYADSREFEEVIEDIKHGKGPWFLNAEVIRNAAIDMMHQTWEEVSDITGIDNDTLHYLVVDGYRFKRAGGMGPIN